MRGFEFKKEKLFQFYTSRKNQQTVCKKINKSLTLSFQHFVILFRTQTYSCAFTLKRIHTTMGASQQRFEAVLVNTQQNMSLPLKQSSIASGAFGLYLLHEFMCCSSENKERVL